MPGGGGTSWRQIRLAARLADVTAGSPTCTCIPSTRCWTAPPGSTACSRPAAQAGMTAIAMTDHGNVYGAYDFYRKAAKAGIKPIIGTEAYVAPEHRGTQAASALGHAGPAGRRRLRCGRVHAHDAARRDHRGHAQPVPAVLAGLARGLLPSAQDGPGAARPVRQGADRDDRLPGRRGADQAQARPVRPGAGGGRDVPRHLRAGQLLRRADGARPGDRAADQGRPAAHRTRSRAAVRRHQRLALRDPGRRPGARGAAVRADRHQHGRPEALQVRGERLLHQVPGRDAGDQQGRRLAVGMRQHAADRGALRRGVQQGEPDA